MFGHKNQSSHDHKVQLPEPISHFPNFGHINLQGVFNCRDLGGMPTEDSRRIKKRRLLRSSELHHATEEDISQLYHMHHLDYIVDLRANYEIKNDPDALYLTHDISYIHLPALSDDSIGLSGLKHPTQDFKTLSNFTKDPHDVVGALYPKCILGEFGIHAYSRLLHGLLKGNDEGSTLWHCTQGKDRTGIATILVLHCLGVSERNIRKDYLATNLFIQPWIDGMSEIMQKNTISRWLGVDLNAYAFASMSYLDLAYKTINDNFGSIDNYIKRILDFDSWKQAQLREMYLESA